jgi:hypothetical protein
MSFLGGASVAGLSSWGVWAWVGFGALLGPEGTPCSRCWLVVVLSWWLGPWVRHNCPGVWGVGGWWLVGVLGVV